MENFNMDMPASEVGHYGAAAIHFRNAFHKSVKEPNWCGSMYVLNSHADTWFRVKDEWSNANGYGLMIKSIRVTGSKEIETSGGYFVKAFMQYTNQQDEADSADIWLFVSKETTVADIMAYIESHKENWVP